ncbi:hypothetical protein EDF66_101714 [Sphingobacterium sp. JUb20]|nr:hypothetical protein [Sphingobacterium sp. JUb21]TCR10899.1 hypothetical protein EDF66_101714 [Sphingobacterium sp. JUb20]
MVKVNLFSQILAYIIKEKTDEWDLSISVILGQ